MQEFDEISVLAAGSATKPRVVVARERDGAGLVVVRTFPVHKLLKAHEKQKFNQKMEHLKKLRHMKVVRFYGGVVGNGKAAVMSRYLKGGSLAEHLQVRKAKSDPLTEEESLKFLEQLSSGLAYLHNCHILHGDLRAQNVFMDKTRTSAKIANLKLTEVAGLQQSSGSFLSQASELAEGLVPDEKADVWGLGLIFAELLNLDAPPVFVEEDARLPCSQPSAQLLLQMLSPEPSERPTAQQVHKKVTGMIAYINEERAEEEGEGEEGGKVKERMASRTHAPIKWNLQSRLSDDRIRRPSRSQSKDSHGPAYSPRPPGVVADPRAHASRPVTVQTPVRTPVSKPVRTPVQNAARMPVQTPFREPEEPKTPPTPLIKRQNQRQMVQERRAEKTRMKSKQTTATPPKRAASETTSKPSGQRVVNVTETGFEVANSGMKIRLGNPNSLLNKLLPAGGRGTAGGRNQKTKAAGRKQGTTAAGRKDKSAADKTSKGTASKGNQRTREHEREERNSHGGVHGLEERNGHGGVHGLEERNGHGGVHGLEERNGHGGVHGLEERNGHGGVHGLEERNGHGGVHGLEEEHENGEELEQGEEEGRHDLEEDEEDGLDEEEGLEDEDLEEEEDVEEEVEDEEEEVEEEEEEVEEEEEDGEDEDFEDLDEEEEDLDEDLDEEEEDLDEDLEDGGYEYDDFDGVLKDKDKKLEKNAGQGTDKGKDLEKGGELVQGKAGAVGKKEVEVKE